MDTSIGRNREKMRPQPGARSGSQVEVIAKSTQKFREKFYCEICHRYMEYSSCKSHINGKKHRKKLQLILREEGGEFWCETCYRNLKSHSGYERHCKAKGHLKHVQRLKGKLDGDAATSTIVERAVDGQKDEPCHRNLKNCSYEQVFIKDQRKCRNGNREKQGELVCCAKTQEAVLHSSTVTHNTVLSNVENKRKRDDGNDDDTYSNNKKQKTANRPQIKFEESLR